VAKLEWNDEAVAAQFYRGLKEQVKDEIARGDRPTSTREMYELAIRIDIRIYKRQLERRGNALPVRANQKVYKQVPEWRNDYYGLQKMQLDATYRKPGPRLKKKNFGNPRKGNG